MLFRNPHLHKIVQEVESLDSLNLAFHYRLYGLEPIGKQIIFDTLQKTRRGEPMPLVWDLIKLIELNVLLTTKLISERTLIELRNFLISHMKGQDEPRTNQVKSN